MTGGGMPKGGGIAMFGKPGGGRDKSILTGGFSATATGGAGVSVG